MGWDVLAFVPFVAFVNLNMTSVISCAAAGDPVLLVYPLLLAVAVWSRGWRRVAAAGLAAAVMKAHFDLDPWTSDAELHGRVALVTGANSGIGLELAKDLARRGATVIFACRSMRKCAAVLPAENARCAQLDVGNLSSIVAFVEALPEPRIDYLVNNAGFVNYGPGHRTADGLESHWGTMHLGHFLLTRLLLPRLTAPREDGLPARVVNHASAAMYGGLVGYLDGDGTSDLRGEVMEGCPGTVRDVLSSFEFCPISGSYSRAKLAQVMFTVELQRRVDRLAASSGSRKIVTSSLHPGIVQSGIVQITDVFVRPTRVGANVLLYCLLESFAPGSFVDEMFRPHDLTDPARWSQPASSYRLQRGPEYETKLWDVSEAVLEQILGDRLPPAPDGWLQEMQLPSTNCSATALQDMQLPPTNCSAMAV